MWSGSRFFQLRVFASRDQLHLSSPWFKKFLTQAQCMITVNERVSSRMGAGVSLSLSRDGVHGKSFIFSLISDPVPGEHGYYVGFVPFSRERGYYGSNMLEGVSLRAYLLFPVYALIFVSLTRDLFCLCERIFSGSNS